MATLAPALVQLRAGVNAAWPDRSKASDGWLGDPAHAARPSDHNPNRWGDVTALDITADGIPAQDLAEHIRQLGATGHPALQDGGYVIFDGRAAYDTSGWVWHDYTGANPHETHIHTSAANHPDYHNRTDAWRIDEIGGFTMDQEARDAFAALKTEQDRQGRLIGEMYQDIHGTDLPHLGEENPRHNSIWTGMQYFRGEFLSGDKTDPNSPWSILQRIKAHFKVPVDP